MLSDPTPCPLPCQGREVTFGIVVRSQSDRTTMPTTIPPLP